MNSLLEEIFSLIISPAGSLAYHLVLWFSIIGALSNSIASINKIKRSSFWRIFGGLIILLAFQLILFICFGLAWQGIINGNLWLPLLDRAVSLLSLVLIVWLWAFPDPCPYVDLGFLLFGLFISVAFLFGFIWWLSQEISIHLNGLPLDRAINIIYLFVSILGCLILIIQKPSGWILGFFMIMILSFGFVLQLIVYQPGEDFLGAVRLAQMVAYPFLLMLPQRESFLPKEKNFSKAKVSVDLSRSANQKPQGNIYLMDPQFWKSLYELCNEKNIDMVYQRIAKVIAETTQADLCLLVDPLDEKGSVNIRCGYDLLKERHLDSINLDLKSIPTLASSFRLGHPRYLESGSTSPDMTNLARNLGLENTGDILFIPIQSEAGKTLTSVALLSPFSKRSLSQQDQIFSVNLSIFLVYFLQHFREMYNLQEELDVMRQMVHNTQDHFKLAFEERERLYNRITALGVNFQKDLVHPTTSNEFGLNNEIIQEYSQWAADKIFVEKRESGPSIQDMNNDKNNIDNISAELRLALEEIAFLNSALAEADNEIQSLKLRDFESSSLDDQLNTLVSIAQDLRLPLSSIEEYTDFLLSDPSSKPSEVQRKYLERIKVSSKRISRLVDDLIQIASLKGSLKKVEFEKTDLVRMIKQAIQECNAQSEEKHISLKMLLQDRPLEIISDEETVNKVFIALLRNAISASPDSGEVTIHARLENIEGQPDYVLIQVMDSGSGILLADLPKVFFPRSKDIRIAGLGDIVVDLSSVKVLVEMLGGRVWVDSELGQGTTFSILLPVSSADSQERNESREVG